MDPRYPVGKFSVDSDVTADKRQQWIAQIASLPADLERALGAVPDGGLDRCYREGGWTVRQVVHHLADSHLNAYTRVKLALTEESPMLKTYDEQSWAELPDARDAQLEPSLAILSGVHTRLTMVLKSLTPAQFTRIAQHPANGQMTIDSLLQMYAWHCRHHLGHIGLVR
ncbi:MAG TPA: putative metal-dependent hydrolase [Vicinamibacterales bacterium]|nr:putative metal-dependent hydrolase [Vicinamibacterales bacterium]